MKFPLSISSCCGAAILSIGLAACGGGGGGGGGGGIGFPVAPAVPTAPVVPVTPVAPAMTMTLVVKVNGVAVSPAATGQYEIQPGDAVDITPSQDASWSSSGSGSGSGSGTEGAISLLQPTVIASNWTAQIVNTTSAVALYTVTAQSTVDAALSQVAVFKIAAGDARNGSYKLFATNGTTQTLTLNFDTETYVVAENVDASVSGTFSEDATTAGTYIFSSNRITTVANTARFRVAQDTVVGAFPFAVTQSAELQYAVQPFVASRAMETSQSGLDGTYNRFGIDVSATTATSNISQFQIMDGGTSLVRCNNSTIYPVANCPTASLQYWTVSAASAAGTWTMVENANPSNYATFSVTNLGGQKIFLLAGKLVGDPMASVFRIGLTESSAWPTGTGYGSSTSGSWGKVNVFAAESYRYALTSTGTTPTAHNLFTPAGTGPQSMRLISSDVEPGVNYFAMQGAKIFAIVGAANNPSTAGYLQINFMD